MVAIYNQTTGNKQDLYITCNNNMTKKDYIKIAKILKENYNGENIIKQFADMLRDDNPNFNYRRFWIACGGKE